GVIDVGRVEEVQTLIESPVDNTAGGSLICFAAEHHRTQTQGRNLEGAATQISIVHHHLHAGCACGYEAAACWTQDARRWDFAHVNPTDSFGMDERGLAKLKGPAYVMVGARVYASKTSKVGTIGTRTDRSRPVARSRWAGRLPLKGSSKSPSQMNDDHREYALDTAVDEMLGTDSLPKQQ